MPCSMPFPTAALCPIHIPQPRPTPPSFIARSLHLCGICFVGDAAAENKARMGEGLGVGPGPAWASRRLGKSGNGEGRNSLSALSWPGTHTRGGQAGQKTSEYASILGLGAAFGVVGRERAKDRPGLRGYGLDSKPHAVGVESWRWFSVAHHAKFCSHAANSIIPSGNVTYYGPLWRGSTRRESRGESRREPPGTWRRPARGGWNKRRSSMG